MKAGLVRGNELAERKPLSQSSLVDRFWYHQHVKCNSQRPYTYHCFESGRSIRGKAPSGYTWSIDRENSLAPCPPWCTQTIPHRCAELWGERG